MEIIFDKNSDFYVSVERAFDEIDKNWPLYQGTVIVGSHNPHGIPRRILAISQARESDRPFLGICLGMQLMLVEYARHCLGWNTADSTEINPKTDKPIFIKLAKRRTGIKPVTWNGITTMETHWHQYAFNKKYLKDYEREWEMVFDEGGILELAKLKNHKFFLGTQFHPEYQSVKGKPHPIIKEFLSICRKKKI